MFPKILKRMRESVQAGTMVFTPHALDEMADDDLLRADIETCILCGDIVHRQWDEEYLEYKYLIDGATLWNDSIEVVAKLKYNKNTVVITAYRL
jgi:Domain of unknown function (DUF4258)